MYLGIYIHNIFLKEKVGSVPQKIGMHRYRCVFSCLAPVAVHRKIFGTLAAMRLNIFSAPLTMEGVRSAVC